MRLFEETPFDWVCVVLYAWDQEMVITRMWYRSFSWAWFCIGECAERFAPACGFPGG